MNLPAPFLATRCLHIANDFRVYSQLSLLIWRLSTYTLCKRICYLFMRTLFIGRFYCFLLQWISHLSCVSISLMCSLYFSSCPLRSVEIFWGIRKFYLLRPRNFNMLLSIGPLLDSYQSFIGCFVGTRNYSILSLAFIASSFRVTEEDKAFELYSLTHTLLLNVFSALKGHTFYVLFDSMNSALVGRLLALFSFERSLC